MKVASISFIILTAIMIIIGIAFEGSSDRYEKLLVVQKDRYETLAAVSKSQEKLMLANEGLAKKLKLKFNHLMLIRNKCDKVTEDSTYNFKTLSLCDQAYSALKLEPFPNRW